jgi:hypothetical protein
MLHVMRALGIGMAVLVAGASCGGPSAAARVEGPVPAQEAERQPVPGILSHDIVRMPTWGHTTRVSGDRAELLVFDDQGHAGYRRDSGKIFVFAFSTPVVDVSLIGDFICAVTSARTLECLRMLYSSPSRMRFPALGGLDRVAVVGGNAMTTRTRVSGPSTGRCRSSTGR